MLPLVTSYDGSASRFGHDDCRRYSYFRGLLLYGYGFHLQDIDGKNFFTLRDLVNYLDADVRTEYVAGSGYQYDQRIAVRRLVNAMNKFLEPVTDEEISATVRLVYPEYFDGTIEAGPLLSVRIHEAKKLFHEVLVASRISLWQKMVLSLG